MPGRVASHVSCQVALIARERPKSRRSGAGRLNKCSSLVASLPAKCAITQKVGRPRGLGAARQRHCHRPKESRFLPPDLVVLSSLAEVGSVSSVGSPASGRRSVG